MQETVYFSFSLAILHTYSFWNNDKVTKQNIFVRIVYTYNFAIKYVWVKFKCQRKQMLLAAVVILLIS